MNNIKLILLNALVLFSISSCGGSNEAKDQKEAFAWYQFEFNEPPSEDVKNVRAKQVIVGDGTMAWLKFQGDQPTAEKIIQKGFIAIGYQDFLDGVKSGNSPSWWKPKAGILYYKIDPWKTNFSYSLGFFAYDPNSKTAFFCHSAID